MTFTNTFARLASLAVLYAAIFIAPGTKEIAIVSPLLILLVDWFFVAQGNVRALARRWWLHASIFIGIFGLYLYFLKPEYFTTILGLKMELHNNMGNQLTDSTHSRITPLWYCISQFKVILHYIAMFFWPFNISVDYDWVMVESFFALDCLLPFLALCTLALYTLYRLRKNRADVISFGIMWFFIAVLPRATIIPGTELVADYKTYLASIGLFFLWALAWTRCIAWLEKRFALNSSWLKALLPVALLMPIGYALYERNKVWRTAEEFWLNILQNAPRKARAYNNYGVSLSAAGKNAEAVPYFQKAFSMDHAYSDPYNNLAVAYGHLGKVDEAIEALQQSIKICPVQPEAYNNIASFYLIKKEYARAEELLKIALRLRPHYGKAYFNLGRLQHEMGKKEEALASFKTACLKADFDTTDGFLYYANCALELKKFDEAIYAFQKMTELSPNDARALAGIANSYTLQNKYEQSLPYFQKLLALNPNNMQLQFQYADLLLVTKHYAESLERFTAILRANPGLVPAYTKTAQCLFNLNRKSEALKLLQEFLQRNPAEEFAKPVRDTLTQLQQGKVH